MLHVAKVTPESSLYPSFLILIRFAMFALYWCCCCLRWSLLLHGLLLSFNCLILSKVLNGNSLRCWSCCRFSCIFFNTCGWYTMCLMLSDLLETIGRPLMCLLCWSSQKLVIVLHNKVNASPNPNFGSKIMVFLNVASSNQPRTSSFWRVSNTTDVLLWSSLGSSSFDDDWFGQGRVSRECLKLGLDSRLCYTKRIHSYGRRQYLLALSLFSVISNRSITKNSLPTNLHLYLFSLCQKYRWNNSNQKSSFFLNDVCQIANFPKLYVMVKLLSSESVNAYFWIFYEWNLSHFNAQMHPVF